MICDYLTEKTVQLLLWWSFPSKRCLFKIYGRNVQCQHCTFFFYQSVSFTGIRCFLSCLPFMFYGERQAPVQEIVWTRVVRSKWEDFSSLWKWKAKIQPEFFIFLSCVMPTVTIRPHWSQKKMEKIDNTMEAIKGMRQYTKATMWDISQYRLHKMINKIFIII